MGFDIHTHAYASACDRHCLARTKGRYAQAMALRSLVPNPTATFQLAKTIDGLPGVNGTCVIMASRVAFFIDAPGNRQVYYESIAEVDEVRRQVVEVNRLRWAGVPRYALDGHLLVFWAFESARHAPMGNILYPTSGDESIGLHCVYVDSFDEATESFRIKNNWGTGWGDRGYGYISLEYLRRFHHETFALHQARWGPSPYKSTRMLAASTDPRETRRLWSIQNPRQVYPTRQKGYKFRSVRYETISPTSGDNVSCYEVTNGFGLRMGWCFLRHQMEGEPITEITELFVWPIFRRMGIGRWLEATAVEEAKYQGSLEIQLIMNEADAVIGPPRARARKFGTACGYDWRWRLGTGPRSHAVGIKAVTKSEDDLS
jgi:GNAT superfamily N-acetyltransferase